MSHKALLEAILALDQRTALQILAEDERLCTAEDEPSALMMALYQGLPDLARAIVARRLTLTVFEATSCHDIPALERILAGEPAACLAFAADGFTALHLAGFFGQEIPAALLLQARADPNARARNATGLCPLHSAAARGNPTICRMLLHAGADPNAVQQGGYTVLHAAALRGNADLAQLLLAWGANRMAATDDGRTASTIARHAGFESLSHWLG